MNFENLQKAWQTQPTGATVTIHTDLLLKEVRRNQDQFRATIFYRDVREVGTCALMTVVFSGMAFYFQDWTWFACAFSCLFVGVFFIVDRLRQRRRQPEKSGTLAACIEHSLAQVNHQIWLLKNVFWWYLLPVILGITIVVGHSLWLRLDEDAGTLISLAAFFILFYGVVYGGVYWFNQWTVRKYFTPRREELETLLASLK